MQHSGGAGDGSGSRDVTVAEWRSIWLSIAKQWDALIHSDNSDDSDHSEASEDSEGSDDSDDGDESEGSDDSDESEDSDYENISHVVQFGEQLLEWGFDQGVMTSIRALVFSCCPYVLRKNRKLFWLGVIQQLHSEDHLWGRYTLCVVNDDGDEIEIRIQIKDSSLEYLLSQLIQRNELFCGDSKAMAALFERLIIVRVQLRALGCGDKLEQLCRELSFSTFPVMIDKMEKIYQCMLQLHQREQWGLYRFSDAAQRNAETQDAFLLLVYAFKLFNVTAARHWDMCCIEAILMKGYVLRPTYECLYLLCCEIISNDLYLFECMQRLLVLLEYRVRTDEADDLDIDAIHRDMANATRLMICLREQSYNFSRQVYFFAKSMRGGRFRQYVDIIEFLIQKNLLNQDIYAGLNSSFAHGEPISLLKTMRVLDGQGSLCRLTEVMSCVAEGVRPPRGGGVIVTVVGLLLSHHIALAEGVADQSCVSDLEMATYLLQLYGCFPCLIDNTRLSDELNGLWLCGEILEAISDMVAKLHAFRDEPDMALYVGAALCDNRDRIKLLADQIKSCEGEKDARHTLYSFFDHAASHGTGPGLEMVTLSSPQI